MKVPTLYTMWFSKYLMEDKRIAKLLLSALLKMEIEDIEFHPKEYATSSKTDKKT